MTGQRYLIWYGWLLGLTMVCRVFDGWTAVLTGMQGRWWANPFPDALFHRAISLIVINKDDFPTD